jgi:hypothetical protein
MRIADAVVHSQKEGWRCEKTYAPIGGDGILCTLSDARITAFKLPTLGLINRVMFDFAAGGTGESIAKDVEQQYGIRLRKKPDSTL